jgi:hypothetical protein
LFGDADNDVSPVMAATTSTATGNDTLYGNETARRRREQERAAVKMTRRLQRPVASMT